MKCLRKWTKRTVAWLAFGVSSVNLVAAAVEQGVGHGVRAVDLNPLTNPYELKWVGLSLLLMLWHQWKNAE
jgi:hypothetical protein